MIHALIFSLASTANCKFNRSMLFKFFFFWFLLLCGFVFVCSERGQFYSEVVTLSRLQWLEVGGLSFSSLSAFKSGERSASPPASSRRANRQSRWLLLGGVMLKTWMRRWDAICRHTPVQYRVRSRRERTYRKKEFQGMKTHHTHSIMNDNLKSCDFIKVYSLSTFLFTNQLKL